MIRIDSDPCQEYLDWIRDSHAYLESPLWGEVLARGLGARLAYAWDHAAGVGHMLATFGRGPFRVGYLGFPICLSPRVNSGDYSLSPMLQAIRLSRHCPDLIRIPLSPFGAGTLPTAPHTSLPTTETCIPDLRVWSAEGTAKRRRYLSIARKRCAGLSIVSNNLDPGSMYQLYRAAVSRNRGVARYGQTYFSALSRLDSRILSVHGLVESHEPKSMLISIRHGDYACYLHGGTARDTLGRGGADMLMARSIENARSEGRLRYNFLSSPIDQPGLSQFKEKWGGETRPSETAQVAAGAKGRCLSAVLAAAQSFRRLHR